MLNFGDTLLFRRVRAEASFQRLDYGRGNSPVHNSLPVADWPEQRSHEEEEAQKVRSKLRSAEKYVLIGGRAGAVNLWRRSLAELTAAFSSY